LRIIFGKWRCNCDIIQLASIARLNKCRGAATRLHYRIGSADMSRPKRAAQVFNSCRAMLSGGGICGNASM
jgi:hypothetical protein